jgi:biotin carboxyl carrier protein
MGTSLASNWLALQCQMIPGASKGIAVLEVAPDGSFEPTARWPADTPPEPNLISVARLALRQRSPVVAAQQGEQNSHDDAANLDVAYPLIKGDVPFGVVAVRVSAPLAQQQAVIQVLRWGAAWLELLLSKQPAADNPDASMAFEVVMAVVAHPHFRAAATALATELAHRLQCTRVSVGLTAGGEVSVVALSDTASFDSRTNLVRLLETAMDESLLHGETLVYPSPPSSSQSTAELHAVLARKEGIRNVCTVILQSQGQAVGALTLERADDPAFEPSTVTVCETVATLAGPVLELKRLLDRPASARLRSAVTDMLGRTGVLLGMAAVAGVLAFFSFATGEYRVTAPAALEGTVHRAIVAPFNGYIAAAHARAGETVEKGAPLAELEDQDLKLQHRQLAGERESLQRQYRRELANLNHAEARILRAQIAQTEAQVSLVDEQLGRARLTAPFAGVVIAGDLSRSLGTPVERGQVLFELAPLAAFRVALGVDGRDIFDVKLGQRGQLRLSAIPEQRFAFVVDNISSISQVETGEASFRVEAHLEGTPTALRPGMRGVGKISVERRKLVWIWLRRPITWVRLWLWSWLP